MGESVVVYFILAFTMIFCGEIMARKYPARRSVLKTIYTRGGKKRSEDVFRFYRTDGNFFLPEIWIPIMVFALVFGCRYNVGVDYHHYLDAYTGVDPIEFEPFFNALTYGLSSAGVHYAIYFIIIAFTEIVLISYAFRKYKYIYPYLAFFLIVGFWYMSLMNVLRQQLAACIFLVSIQYILDRKPLKYYLCVLLACMFHKSALLLVVIYPLFRWKQDWFKHIYIQIIALFAAIVIAKLDLVTKYVEVPFVFFTEKLGYSQYSIGILTNENLNNKAQFGRNSGFGVYAQILKFLPIMLYSEKMKAFFKDTFFEVAYSIWFVGVMATLMLSNSIVLIRPFVYANNFLHIVPAFFFYYCVKQKKKMTTIWLVGLIALYLLLFYNLISNGEMNTSAFTFFWQHEPVIE